MSSWVQRTRDALDIEAAAQRRDTETRIEGGWEAGMAERAAARRVEREAVERRERDDANARWWARWDEEGLRWVADMTLDGATQRLRAPAFACACVGPPACCTYGFQQARALQRVAHIAVKQLNDLAGRMTR